MQGKGSPVAVVTSGKRLPQQTEFCPCCPPPEPLPPRPCLLALTALRPGHTAATASSAWLGMPRPCAGATLCITIIVHWGYTLHSPLQWSGALFLA